jgi:hypothetical protein
VLYWSGSFNNIHRMGFSDRPIEGPRLGGVVINARNVSFIVVLGSVWGLAELFGRDLASAVGVGGTTTWLAVWAVLLLGFGRGFWSRAGSSTLMGLIAATFKFLGPFLFYCQLLGIVAIGLFFDLFASILLARGRKSWWRQALVGALTIYSARAFFVSYSVFVAQWDRWVDGGAGMALEHVFGSGSIAAAAAFLVVPIGLRLGRRVAETMIRRPAGDSVAADNR